MNSVFGALVLFVALITSLYATFAALRGAKKNNPVLVDSARNAAIAVWPLLTLAALVLVVLLVRNDYNVKYVWSVTDNAMPTYLKITALWGSQAGSLLFWSWLMSTFTAASMLRDWRNDRHLMPAEWGPTDQPLNVYLLPTPAELPDGRYELRLLVYDAETLEPLTLVGEAGNPAGQEATLGMVEIRR